MKCNDMQLHWMLKSIELGIDIAIAFVIVAAGYALDVRVEIQIMFKTKCKKIKSFIVHRCLFSY